MTSDFNPEGAFCNFARARRVLAFSHRSTSHPAAAPSSRGPRYLNGRSAHSLGWVFEGQGLVHWWPLSVQSDRQHGRLLVDRPPLGLCLAIGVCWDAWDLLLIQPYIASHHSLSVHGHQSYVADFVTGGHRASPRTDDELSAATDSLRVG
ncbi:hypothetical protein BD626DRAFT_476546 [Schizophyllum amplum]|uniref:Uncharacterized protein n=1 Tax=Schizophyllum amplum TaxID=97359 RepID=A0A550CZG3_9AGAR|nr:hypothetical protein BD626DRAFT_476546 [Auriculariopsis ampla]